MDITAVLAEIALGVVAIAAIGGLVLAVEAGIKNWKRVRRVV